VELIVCERWTMPLPERSGDEWFLDWVLKSPHQRSTAAGWAAYQALALVEPEMRTAHEFFGGVGAQSLMIQDLWAPKSHLAMDYTPESAAHLSTIPGVTALQADSYDPKWSSQGADLVALDFGDFTVWKSREGEQHRALIDRVFAEEPKGVVMTDIACRYLHLHRTRYETLLGAGRCESYQTYLEALADRFEALYGYTMVGGFWHGRWSSVMAFAQEGTRVKFAPAPESPVGLKVVE
jgi:hypothetical protein